jgi:hypothetical protein
MVVWNPVVITIANGATIASHTELFGWDSVGTSIFVIGHSILGKGYADDVTGEILKPFLVNRPQGGTIVNFKAAVASVHKVIDKHVADSEWDIGNFVQMGDYSPK